MKFTYFPDTDTLDVQLLEGPAADGFDVAKSVIAQAKADGRVESLEIDFTTKTTSLDYLSTHDPTIQWATEAQNSELDVQQVPNRSNGRAREAAGTIWCNYDRGYDFLDIRFTKEKPTSDIFVAPSIWLELNDAQRIIGLTIGFASSKIANLDPTGMTPCVEWETHVQTPELVPAT